MSLPHARATVARMAGYTPGEQPKPDEQVIKLNTNENPYPPSPAVFEAIGSIGADALRRYPQPMADDFRDVAARVHGVTRNQVLAGNGSDDILQIALRSYCGPGDVLATGTPGGTGNRRSPQLFMKPGDMVEIEREGIGIVRNRVIAEA